jgi:branched-chain amino acid transport system substrate-binding protein
VPKKRKLIATAIAVVSLMAAAACGSSSSGGKASSPSGGTGATTVKVGVLWSLTGLAESYGQDSKKGSDIAFQMANDSLLKGQYVLQPEYKDDASDPERAVPAMAGFASDSSIQAVVGGTLQASIQAIAPSADDDKLPLISATGTAADLSSKSPYLWAAVPNNQAQADSVYDALSQIAPDAKNIAILHDDRDLGLEQSAEIVKDAQAGGKYSVVCNETVASAAQTAQPQLLDCENKKPDVYVLLFIDPLATVVLKDAQQLGIHSTLLGDLGYADTSVLSAAGSASEGMYVTSLLVPNHPITTVQAQFVKAFQAKYHEAPTNNNEYGFDVVWALANALKAASAPTRAAINQAMSGLTYTGGPGDYNFGTNHQGWSNGGVVARVNNAQMVPVS